ncbi:formate dehydrogenase accessory protein FdhE [Chitinasiproducens palmae]|uniref:Protein FdhE homolog n=1 Tax=Chitinasiproducens palmae TaxID=1770053 RepID=A0A1H2PST5_9BURK|nr:formate dehydrogenase accessory protein FdhE [Chitinasiproducens palmae]SDV50093.1 FdhE protein [Chitinasiproducens palmae]
MASRLMEPEQIAAMNAAVVPRLRMPARATVFGERAARLQQLADNSTIGDYLRFVARLVGAQQTLLAEFETPMPSAESIAVAQRHSMPVLPAMGARPPLWRDVLSRLLDLMAADTLPPPLQALIAQVRGLDGEALEQLADAVLNAQSGGSARGVDPASAPFVMAALQVVWTDLASRLAPAEVPYLDTPGHCPCCGSLPVASVVRIGGVYQGYRFLQCGLCATEWHMVRIKCSHCDSTEGIAYHGIEGTSDALKAETCDHCGTYRKIVYLEKDMNGEAFADDLASLPLDLMVTEAGFKRSSGHPFLWQAEQDEDDQEAQGRQATPGTSDRQGT